MIINVVGWPWHWHACCRFLVVARITYASNTTFIRRLTLFLFRTLKQSMSVFISPKDLWVKGTVADSSLANDFHNSELLPFNVYLSFKTAGSMRSSLLPCDPVSEASNLIGVCWQTVPPRKPGSNATPPFKLLELSLALHPHFNRFTLKMAAFEIPQVFQNLIHKVQQESYIIVAATTVRSRRP